MSEEIDSDAGADIRKKRLMEQLAATPIVTVLGVVDASGAWGGKSLGEELWTLGFTFGVWRVAGADLRATRLRIQRKVTYDELTGFRAALTRYAVVRIEARLVENSVYGSSVALLESIVGPDTSDPELNQHAEELQVPVVDTEALFGTLALDRSLDQYTAEATWMGLSIELSLSGDLPSAVKAATALWQNQTEWNQRVQDFAVAKLLAVKNDSWLDEGEGEVTADQFRAKLVLEEISVRGDGSFMFWHTDNDLFWGHWIEIKGNLSDGPTHADIPG